MARMNLPSLGGGGGAGGSAGSALRGGLPSGKTWLQTLQKPKASNPGKLAAPKKAAPKRATTPYRAPVYRPPARQVSNPAPRPKPVPKPAVKAAPKPAPKPKAPNATDWLTGDATYQATLAALAKQLSNFGTDLDTQLGNYQTNYGSSLKDLGYTPGANGADGSWNFEDPLTASGRAYQNLTNDFASRGLLQSSSFGDSQEDLTKSLQDQLTQLNTARDQFTTGLGNQRSAYTDQNQTAAQQAKAESIARRAAKYGLA